MIPISELIKTTAALQKSGRFDDAVNLYQRWLKQGDLAYRYIIYYNLGSLLQQRSRPYDAIEAYKSCLIDHPLFGMAVINLGLCFEQTEQYEDALLTWRQLSDQPLPQLIEDKQLYLAVLNHQARLLEDLNRLEEANAALERSLQIDSSQTDVLHHWVHVQQKTCNWPVYRKFMGIPTNRMLLATSPLPMLALVDDPPTLLLNAREFVRRKWGFSQSKGSFVKPIKKSRIKIGYVSGDFCTHAVGLLMPDFLRLHDRENFEVFAYDYSPEDGSATRQRLKETFDCFRSIKEVDDTEAAQKIVADGIDVLIDMHGLSSGARPGIFSLRPAVLQGTYLGFIGTTGMPWLDFLVADRYTIPDDEQIYYTEEILYVEPCFLPLALNRPANNMIVTRSSCHLPEQSIVMAAFGNIYKTTEPMLQNWIHILKEVPNSVLWLLDDNPVASSRLKLLFSREGVDPIRIIFTPRVAYAQYLARLSLADLFLDTYPYNCGSTTRDVVSAGVPIITRSGRTMVSRMTGSVLKSVGLEMLVARSDDHYRQLAVQLATDGPVRDAVRRHLMEVRNISTLLLQQLVSSFESGIWVRLERFS